MGRIALGNTPDELTAFGTPEVAKGKVLKPPACAEK
jgi:hypothetical protein